MWSLKLLIWFMRTLTKLFANWGIQIMKTLTKLIVKMWTSKLLIGILRTLTKLTVKYVDFKAFYMHDRTLTKWTVKNVDTNIFINSEFSKKNPHCFRWTSTTADWFDIHEDFDKINSIIEEYKWWGLWQN